MPVEYGQATEMIGPLTPALVCWASLILTVVGLLVGFFYTNITAFARRLRTGRREATLGSEPKEILR
ncbi:hypothetical protein HC891_24300 [Candidatus Gracilibacteria bacterium]|nr:hypothetical protein [Candidatus Gracilibacteria bacterium]